MPVIGVLGCNVQGPLQSLGLGYFHSKNRRGTRFAPGCNVHVTLQSLGLGTFNRRTFNPWTNPFGDGQRFDSTKQCAANESTTAWMYRDGFLVSEESIGKVLDELIRRTRKEYENTLRKLKLTN
ncbi:hypothetical protein GPALN_011628 [Globodera pallida]|nr:hypothetical protein GPALN_011628 [Globodera pallida]